ncbi:MAG: YidC/Oxa1 family membrane protein insertase [Actinomycetota bacterium]|nr:YidC/Oxa1 family membrane protein insertase [Actinomycetota bacterium]
MTSGVLDAVIVAAAGLGLRRLRGRPWHDAFSGAQWDSLVVAGCYFVAGAALTGRTVGQAVLGLWMADEVTHGRPGWRAAMIRWAIRQPPQVLLIAVSGLPSVRRALEQLRELQPDVDELRSRYGRNDRELSQSLMDLYEARMIAPFNGWPLLMAILAGMAYDGIVTAGVLRPPRRQGLHDRLAHVLVLDR